MHTKYGVNTFINEIHINEVDFDETFKMPEYLYVIEIIEINSHNGNGLKEMKIYTEGKLVELKVGDWKISPIVKLPYSWSGFIPEIEMIDKAHEVLVHKGRVGETVYHTRDYVQIIKWVFNTVKEFDKIQNVKQLKLYDSIYETNRLLNIYKTNGVNINKMNEFVAMLDNEINQLKSLKEILTEENYQLSRIKINSTIDLFNEIRLNRIEEK